MSKCGHTDINYIESEESLSTDSSEKFRENCEELTIKCEKKKLTKKGMNIIVNTYFYHVFREKRREEKMKKWKFLVVVGIMVLGCAGCGTQKEKETGAADMQPVDVVQTGSDSEEAEAEFAPTEGETEERNDNLADLEEKAAGGDVTAFAEQIQAAVFDKDLEALADLCSYPLAVNGEEIDSREAFMELGADTVFTEDRCAVIEAVDVSALEETMAGIVMGDATPNIIFQSVDGELGITGIN